MLVTGIENLISKGNLLLKETDKILAHVLYERIVHAAAPLAIDCFSEKIIVRFHKHYEDRPTLEDLLWGHEEGTCCVDSFFRDMPVFAKKFCCGAKF